MATTQAEKLKALQQAFVTADKDGDSVLNKDEFKEFVEIGYHKQCPPAMYDSLCNHFNRDPNIGIDWNTARAVWIQAQSPSRSKSPSPPSASAAVNNGSIATQSSSIKQAFIECDKDGDSLLNKQEFTQFVCVGFKKPNVPQGMYETVCSHFKKDVSKGIDWLSAYSLWKQSNAAPKQTRTRTKTPPPQKKTNNSLKARAPLLKRVATAANVSNKSMTKSRIPEIAQLSPNKSTGQILNQASALTEKNLMALDSNHHHSKSVNNDDDQRSVESASSYSQSQSQQRRHRRVTSIQRGNASFDDGPNASEIVVQMMETKVKNLQNQLKLERTKRKKTEELAQSLLHSNEEYKKQIGDLSTVSSKYKTETERMRDELRRAKQTVDDDRNTIRHLKEQKISMKKERDEAYALIDKLEKKYETQLKKERVKHKTEIQQSTAGFLQSLGAEPGKDLAFVIRELKLNNIELQKNVDTLAETLARKQQSLLAALEAVDNIAMEEEKQFEQQNTVALTHEKGHKMKEKLKQLNERRKSFGNVLHKKGDSISLSADINMANDDTVSGLPKPPKRRNSQIGMNLNVDAADNKPHHRTTASFFKRAVGKNINMGAEKQKKTNDENGKQLEFVSQQLSNDAKANKTQSIQNLELANTALMQQMQKMKKQMQEMSHSKQQRDSSHSINDLP